jgi:hypothetical protein
LQLLHEEAQDCPGGLRDGEEIALYRCHELCYMEASLRGHHPELCKMTTYRIDGLGPLPYQKIASAKYYGDNLLLFALHRHEPHGRPLGCFADRFPASAASFF